MVKIFLLLINFSFALWLFSCNKLPVNMQEASCKIYPCLSGYSCDENTDRCVLKPLQNKIGGMCRYTGERIPCNVNEKTCLKGCRDCGPDLTWSACKNNPDCDLDNDRDGLFNCVDNCPDIPNPLQEDFDNNGLGDACDKYKLKTLSSLISYPQKSLVSDKYLLKGTFTLKFKNADSLKNNKYSLTPIDDLFLK